MDIYKAQTLAHKLMEQHGLIYKRGLHDVPPWSFVWDRAKRRHGQCRYSRKQISLSRPLTRLLSEDEVRDTILHEIAHALIGPGHGHGPEWKEQARAIGCNASRGYSGGIHVPKKWRGTCPNCKRSFLYHRRRALSCKHCFLHVKGLHAFIYTRNS